MTTDDEELAERIRLLRDLGQSGKYTHVIKGWNDRLDTIQAAVLRVKLRHLDRWNALRRRHAAAYEDAPRERRRPDARARRRGPSTSGTSTSSAREKRDELRAALAAERIETGLHYPLPLHLQPALADLGYSRGDFPATEAWAEELLSLPMFPELEPSEIERVALALSGVRDTDRLTRDEASAEMTGNDRRTR